MGPIKPHHPGTYKKASFTRDRSYAIVEVDADTLTMKGYSVIPAEEHATCYMSKVLHDCETAVSGCGMFNGRTGYTDGSYRFNAITLKHTEPATFNSKIESKGLRFGRATEWGERSTLVSAEGLFADGPAGLKHIRVNSTEHAQIDIRREDEIVLLGANLMNMGREDYFTENNDEVSYYKNIIVGTDSGNVRNGLTRSVLIGTNIINHNPNFKDGSNADGDLPTDTPAASGIFAIGHDHELLFSGNFDTMTLNLPKLRRLEKTVEATAAIVASEAHGVVFTNDNVVLAVNDGVQIDGFKLSEGPRYGTEQRLCIVDALGRGMLRSVCSFPLSSSSRDAKTRGRTNERGLWYAERRRFYKSNNCGF